MGLGDTFVGPSALKLQLVARPRVANFTLDVRPTHSIRAKIDWYSIEVVEMEFLTGIAGSWKNVHFAKLTGVMGVVGSAIRT